ncbi:sensor histidine kinase [Anoxynatronum sibiricum]|uniref:Oxygen sensor histidine kinase NreB n=1 Tax=Anoxynatronum sibiricum TaxID=210623 RepID=A0ABU9VS86_9CLOT
MAQEYVNNAEKMNQVLSRIFTAIEESKEEIFEMTDTLNKECSRLEDKLSHINDKVKAVIDEVEVLERKEKRSRRVLVDVSRDFSRHSEEMIRNAYEQANDLQIQLIIKRQEEEELARERKDVEMHIRNARATLERAERLTTKFSVALEFLEGNMEDFSNTITDLEQRQLLGRKIIQVQEEERRRVSREIHDGPAQTFSNILLKIDLCEKLMNIDMKRAREETASLKQIVRQSTKEIRKIIYNLRPMAIDDLGLEPTLRRYIEDFETDSGLKIVFEVVGELQLEDAIHKLALFRVVQEALNNVNKHAKATACTVMLKKESEQVMLMIRDNGRGFDLNRVRVSQENGFGIMNMKERVELLNGNLKIDSTPGQGTILTVTLPLQLQEV